MCQIGVEIFSMLGHLWFEWQMVIIAKMWPEKDLIWKVYLWQLLFDSLNTIYNRHCQATNQGDIGFVTKILIIKFLVLILILNTQKINYCPSQNERKEWKGINDIWVWLYILLRTACDYREENKMWALVKNVINL